MVSEPEPVRDPRLETRKAENRTMPSRARFLALMVLSILDARLLTRTHLTICSGTRFSPIDPGLAPFQLRWFFVGKQA